MSRLIDADNLKDWIKRNANPYGRPTLDFDTALEVMSMIDRMSAANAWIPADQLPETDETEMSDYILLSFENFPVPLVGIYELDEDGNGAYYVGDSEKSCISQGYVVNAWMSLPKPYKGGQDE